MNTVELEHTTVITTSADTYAEAVRVLKKLGIIKEGE